jgi:predicted lipid-binding transport protein (Tim44 family)
MDKTPIHETKARLTEPSTWAGLGGLLMGVAGGLPAMVGDGFRAFGIIGVPEGQILLFAAGAAAFVAAILLPERRR